MDRVCLEPAFPAVEDDAPEPWRENQQKLLDDNYTCEIN